ncbi:MAG: Ig domain-containing protein [Holophagaceae bacterium]|nr:Ig domain-containing protein [Holophagaceae bacterium]
MGSDARGTVFGWTSMLLALMTLLGCGGGSAPPPAPSGLSYGRNPAVYTLGQAVAPNRPAWSGGEIRTFSVTPSLPPGLALDAVSGVLTGTPTVLKPVAIYTVTGMGPGGSTQAQVQLTVVDVPPAISYGNDSYTFTTGQAIAALVPTNLGGAAVSWSISPAIPAGLVFSTADGSLSGTPTAVSASMSYLITATNSGGSSSVSPSLAVNPLPPSISAQPADTTVDFHAAATFTVTATGTGSLTYQWRRDGAPIAGATGTTCTSDPLVTADDGAAFSVVVSDGYGGSTTSASAHVTVRAELATWLTAHPRVAAAIRWQFRPADPANAYLAPADTDKVAWAAWSSQQQADLNQAFLDAKAWLAQGAHPVVMDPAGLTDEPVNQHPQTSIDSLTTLQWVTPVHMWKLYVAHVAFALAQEITHPLPWSLVDDTDETLRYLLDSSVKAWNLPNGNFWMGTYAGAYPPALRADTRPHTTFAPPMWTYPWLQQAGLIGTTRQETIGKVLEWMRGNMAHFYGPDTFGNHQAVWQYRGHVPLSKIVGGTIDANNPGLGTQHWTAGCHGSVGFLHAVLRVLNVPVQPVWICGHELAYFPSEKLYLDHGDDPYNQVVKNHPTSPVLNLLIDEATYQAWFTPDLTVNINGTNAAALANVGRKAAEFQ